MSMVPIGGRVEAQAFPWPVAQIIDDVVALGMRERAHASSLGQVLPDRPSKFSLLPRSHEWSQPHSRIAASRLCIYNNSVRITCDPAKRMRTLVDRGLDFDDAALVFEGTTVEVEDTRKDYGERRIICYGMLEGRMVVVGYTPRGQVRHIFSMRKANDREQTRLAPYLEI